MPDGLAKVVEESVDVGRGSAAVLDDDGRFPSVEGTVVLVESSLAGSEGSDAGLGVCVERFDVGSEGESCEEFAPELFRPDPSVGGFDSMVEAGGVLGDPSSLEESLREEEEPDSLSFVFFFFPTIDSHCFSKLPKLE